MGGRPAGWAAGWVLEEMKLRLTQPSLVELGLGLSLAKISYIWFYSEKAQEQVSVAKLMMTKLKTRERILEEIT